MGRAAAGGPAVAAIVAAWALLFAPAILGDGQFLYRDAGRMHHPVKSWIAEELRRGHVPEWNPYAGMGVPVVATSVDAPLHPLNALLATLPFEAAFKAWVLLSVLAAGLGVAAWARALGRSAAGAATAGLAFMLSGFVVSSTDNLQYLTSLAGAPWLLASAHHSVRRGAGGLVAVAVASFVTAAGGDPMGWAVAVALSVTLPMLLDAGVTRRRVLGAAVVGGIAALAAAPVILPILAWLPHSSRAADLTAQDHASWNLHPVRLLELAVPHLLNGAEPGALRGELFQAYAGNSETAIPWVASIYAGAAALALAGFAALRERGARRLALVAAVLAWVAMGPYAGFGQLARHLPILSSFRFWEKFVVWVTLLAAAAAGAGVDRLLGARREARLLALVAGLAGAPLVACWAFAALAPASLARWVERADAPRLAEALVGNVREGTASAAASLAVLAAAAALVARGRLARFGPVAIAAIVAVDLGAANVRAYVLSSPRLLTEPSPLAERLRGDPGLPRVVTPFRIAAERWPELTQSEAGWRWLSRTAGAPMNVARRIGNFEVYTGMLPARFIRFATRVQPATLAPRAALWGFAHVVVPESPERASAAGLSRSAVVRAADPGLPAYLLRQPARPRVALAGVVQGVDEARALEFVLSPGAAASDLTVVEGAIPDAYSPPSGLVRLVVDEPERLVVEAEVDRPSLVVVNDEWAPGWTAEVDGRATPIVAANYRARGVWVPAGRHTVVLRYRTPLLREGLVVAAGTAVVLAVAWLRQRGRRRAEA